MSCVVEGRPCRNYIPKVDDEFDDFAEYVASSFCEMWDAKYGGAFVDRDGNPIFIKKVMYHNPKVIVIWNDDTKTVASCSEDDKFNPEAGLSIAIMKRLCGKDEMDRLYSDWLPYKYMSEGDVFDDFEVNISDVRKAYKAKYKIEDEECKKCVISNMKEYLESCGYKVEKK